MKGRRGRLKTCRGTPGQSEDGLRTDGGKPGQIEAEENKKWRTIRLPCLDTEWPYLVALQTKLSLRPDLSPGPHTLELKLRSRMAKNAQGQPWSQN